ncbi:MAG: DUF2059 domain-containing protein [Roseobacter sp.]
MLKPACVSVAFAVCAVSASADARLTALTDALEMDTVVGIMRDEGLSYAQELNDDMLAGQGGAFWTAQVTSIYNAQRMSETVLSALDQYLSPDDIDEAIRFFTTAHGAQIISLENASRIAMQDALVEETAKQNCVTPASEDAAHLALIDQFTNVNDLIERNVSGAMSSTLQFYAGLAQGNSFALSEEDTLKEVYSQEAEIREDTVTWLCGYLLLAYRPLSLEALQAYVAFYETDAGKALNSALFEGYEQMYRDISYALGQAVALNVVGDDI